MSASGHYTRGRSLRIKDKAVSVSSSCCRRSSSPTLSIGSRRARLLTSSAALRSPQTCFRLPHCLGCFAACGFPRPPALRDADYRLPPVILLPLWMLMLLLMVVVVVGKTNRGTSASVVFYLLVVLVYIGKRDNTCILLFVLHIVLLGILRLLIIPAFGEILPSNSAKVGARPPLSTVTTAWTVSAAAGRAGKRSAAASMPASRHRSIAGVIWLLYAGRAVKEEPQAAGAADKGIWYARQSRQKPPQTRIRLAPNPRGNDPPGRSASREGRWCASRHNITRNCVTAAQFLRKNPKPLHNRSLC